MAPRDNKAFSSSEIHDDQPGTSKRRPVTPGRSKSPAPLPLPTPSSALSPQRKVRTVPPSAKFEPADSPSPRDEAAPAQGESSRAGGQPRHSRLQYSTSEEDSSEYDDSDRDPEFWTFTPAGMQKLIAKSQRHVARLKGGGTPIGDAEKPTGRRPSGGSTVNQNDTRMSRRPRRGPMSGKSSRSETDTSASRTGMRIISRRNSASKLPKTASSSSTLLQPKPIRNHTQSHLFRKTFGLERSNPMDDQSLTTPPKRSNSAPTAVEDIPPEEMPISRVPPASLAPSDSETETPKPRVRRLATSPAFSPFLRHRGEILTDSETAMSKSPRYRSARFENPMLPLGAATNEQGESLSRNALSPNGGTFGGSPSTDATPTRAQPNRTNTHHHRLRLTIPPPLQQKLSHWQQPGSWVDAMYENYEGTEGTRRNEPGAGPIVLTESPRPDSQIQLNNAAPPETPSMGKLKSSPLERSPMATVPGPKVKRKKPRRYRTALIPPTPGGLGFEPSVSVIKSTQQPDGFDWNPRPSSTSERNVTDESMSGATSNLHEKSSPAITSEPPWWRFGKKRDLERVAAKKRFKEDWSRTERLKVRMFSDVRVTIYSRLANLVVVIIALGLAVSIRTELYQLSLPGIMGPSTTLIISFASFTIAHILTAIYREYKGRPIGLWDLHSKMLWVCLDLLFVALWAVAAGMAINDYLSTPLECSPIDEWWTSGLADGYAQLMASFGLATSSARISNLLGLALPSEITNSALVAGICDRQIGEIVLSLSALILYAGNMVVSLFRIFETVRRTNGDRPGLV